jgi:hypothetical protein
MIQRIQTLFLLFVVALAAALFSLPVFVTSTTSTAKVVSAVPHMIQSDLLTSIVVALSGLTAFISIFLYRNRQRQTLLCRLNLLFILAALGLILQASDTSSLPRSVQVSVSYSLAVCFPVAQIVFNWLALRFIKKDDDLVRSAERLR